MINLNTFPLSISCVSPYKLKIVFISRKSDNFKYLIYFQFEIFSNVRAEILWYGDFLRHEGQVLRGIPVLCLVVLSATGLSSQECSTVLPEVLWGTKEHQGDTTLMKCRQPCFVLSGLWPHQSHYLKSTRILILKYGMLKAVLFLIREKT